MNNYLKIYTSSAGSGKTFTLVKEYLNIVLQRPEEYRHILAITFTNKAANEMKSRVIEALISLESGEPSELRSKLEETVPSKNITDNAGKVLKLILHDYPSFAISTIDSFFQKLLRSLAREIHLPLRAEIKLEEEDAILEVTDKLLQHSGTDKELGGWLQQLIFKKLEDDKGWNIQNEIAWIAKEILKERGATGNVMERSTIHELYGTMNQRKKNFEANMNGFGKGLFACTAFTGDQNRHLGRSHCSGDFEKFVHLLVAGRKMTKHFLFADPSFHIRQSRIQSLACSTSRPCHSSVYRHGLWLLGFLVTALTSHRHLKATSLPCRCRYLERALHHGLRLESR